MVKGVAAKFHSYQETIPKVLKIVKFDEELKKHEKIILKPNLINPDAIIPTSVEFLDPILRFISEHKNPGTQVFIAEGSDGHETNDLFNQLGYTKMAEKYGIGLIDLNEADSKEISHEEFISLDSIMYPSILLESFIISLPKLSTSSNHSISASLDNMRGAYPSKHYKGWFSSSKNKLNKNPVSSQIIDILKCKMPEYAIVDASDKGYILLGQPHEIDKQCARLLGLDPKKIHHLNYFDKPPNKFEKEVEELVSTNS